MLRPSSEMAVAITVRSLLVKPSRCARERPCWRALTMSASEWMGTQVSAGSGRGSLATTLALPGLARQPGEAFFEVQRGRHPFQAQPHLDHGEGHVGLDADDDGLRTAQPGHIGDAAERATGERIEHVEHGDVDDDAARPRQADALDQVVLQLTQVLVSQGRLDRGDQVFVLFEDRNLHRAPPGYFWLVGSSRMAL